MGTATGDSKWITNEAARAFSRSLRGKYQAILVGINTVLRDDPHLGARPAVGGARATGYYLRARLPPAPSTSAASSACVFGIFRISTYPTTRTVTPLQMPSTMPAFFTRPFASV